MEFLFHFDDFVRSRPNCRRFSATATGTAMASAMEAESDRKPEKSDSTTSNQHLAKTASGEKTESVIATTQGGENSRHAPRLNQRS
jgi:hypothetical protein